MTVPLTPASRILCPLLNEQRLCYARHICLHKLSDVDARHHCAYLQGFTVPATFGLQLGII